jgi:hypothetical protein
MTEEQARAIFLLAGVPAGKLHRLENGYWPEAYVERRRDSPWWLATTEYGPVVIGWRKRVISIDWSDTKVRAIVTDHDVTKDETGVHAWGYASAVEYLTEWRRHAERKRLAHQADGEKGE